MRFRITGRLALAHPVKHFRIRAAGSRLSRRTPPVFCFGKEGDAVLRDPEALPDFRGLRVFRRVAISLEARDREALDWNFKYLRQKAKTHFDRFFLKVVAETPVAQHLEAGEVGIIPDFVDILRAHAKLDVGESRAEWMLFTHEIGDEGVHARRREENRRIILRSQRGTGNDRMAILGKEIEVGRSQGIGRKTLHG